MRDWLNNHRGMLWIAQAIALVLLGFLIALWFGGSRNAEGPPAVATSTAASSAAQPTIWTCSMHPQIRRDGPGDCPICGMDLVPVKESAGGVRTVSISDAARKLMNLEVLPVQRRYVTTEVRMVGKVGYDETRLAYITAWVPGRLERMFVDFTGVEVKKGDHMVQIYSEQLYTAQQELLSAIEQRNPAPRSRFIEPIDLAESAREKLRLLGLTPEQIQAIEQRGTASETVTIYSPVGGVVVDKMRQEGDRVQTGDRIYTVADLQHLWVQLDAYESDLAWLRYGQDVEFTTEAYPGEVFRGRIAFIDPVLNADTRTVKVRVNVSNERGRLKPEMFVRAVVKSHVAAGGKVLDASLAGKWISPMHPEIIKDEPGECDVCGMPLVRAESLGYVTAEPANTEKPLVVPASAVLLTGKRAIVYVQVPDADKPTYEGREIVVGPRAGDYYLVKAGLKEGELVVTHGNFKLDSALQIAAKPSMMMPQTGGAMNHPKTQAAAEGGASLPPAVVQPMEQILKDFAVVQEAIETANLPAARLGFAAFGKTVESVPADQIDAGLRPQWLEIAMLLRNDAVEGAEVTSLQEADRLFALTRQHLAQMTAQFPLPSQAAAQEPEAIQLAVTPQIARQLGALMPVYLQLSEALAGDDFGAAKQAVDALHGVISQWPSEPDPAASESEQVWQKEKRDLSEIVARLQHADDLETVRSPFSLLSESLLSLQRMFDLPHEQPLFEVHCPMAFDGRGASWIQQDEAVRNPYYGASMLKCADKVEKL